jgi:hypothetical protein
MQAIDLATHIKRCAGRELVYLPSIPSLIAPPEQFTKDNSQELCGVLPHVMRWYREA